MNKEVRNRFLFVVLLALIVSVFSLPISTFQSIFGAESSVTQKMQQYRVSLGLDLVGGTELDYRIDMSEAEKLNSDEDPQNDVNLEWIAESVRDALEARVNPAGVGEIIVKRSKVDEKEHVLIQMPPSSNVADAKQDAEKDNRLEFYEEDPSKEDAERAQYNTVREEINGGNFDAKVAELTQGENSAVYYRYEPKFRDAFSDGPLADKLFAAKAGDILEGLQEVTSEPSFTIDENGQAVFEGGFERLLAVVRVGERTQETRSKTTPPQATARHILISYKDATRADQEKSVETAEAPKTLAEEIFAEIQNGADFAETAQEKSMGPSGENGGDLGTFGPGKMTAAFEDAIFGDKDEEGNYTFAPAENYLIPEIVETDFGYHIIEVQKLETEKTEEVLEDQVGYDILGWDRTEMRWIKTELDGSHLEAAAPAYDQQVGTPIVSLRFTALGGDLFADITERIAGRSCDNGPCLLGAKVGGVWVSQATVREKIVGRDAIISGQFNFDQVKELASDLNLGAIAAPVTLSGETTIKAELGEEQLQASMKAAAMGLAATIVFMIVMYRMAGVVAALALLLYCGMFMTILKTWPESFGGPIVLSLSGVAGMALSVGLAVDGNILIFERMKEELQCGKNIGKAMQLGFERAWNAIWDSNMTTLLTCVILFVMGSSIIRGFSIMLIVGTILSMFSATVISRNLLRFFLSFEGLRKPALYAMGKTSGKKKSKKGFNITGLRKAWFGLSGALVIVSFALIGSLGLNLGLDFTGGARWDVQFSEELSVEKDQLEDFFAKQEVLTQETKIQASEDGTYLVTIQDLEDAQIQEISGKLSEEVGAFEQKSYRKVDATIGASFKKKSLWALLYALGGIILFVAFAFRRIPSSVNPWRFGSVAIVALFHDVVIVAGIFAILGQTMGAELDLTFVTALLATLGFSVNDTIVILDRVRENIHSQKPSETFEDTIEKSVKQTLHRSINTSVSTLLPLIGLLLLGAQSIFYFVLALALGILVGTYSSIFLAAPMLAQWKVWSDKREQ